VLDDPVPGGPGDLQPARGHLPARPRGWRPVYGGTRKFQEDPHWRDYLLFHEYFHGDNGAGLGASHQTGWSALIPALVQLFARVTPEMILAPEPPATILREERREAPGEAHP
jgi:hypothetical protein